MRKYVLSHTIIITNNEMNLLISYFFLQEDLSFSYSAPDHLVFIGRFRKCQERGVVIFPLGAAWLAVAHGSFLVQLRVHLGECGS